MEPPSLTRTPSTRSSVVSHASAKPDRRISLGVLDSARFRLSHDFARLVRSPSAASSKSTAPSTHGSRSGPTEASTDYENDSTARLDLDDLDMSRNLTDERPSRRAKIYEFLSRSTSRSRSRSKSTTRRSESNESPPDLPFLSHSATTTSTSATSDSHYDEHATPTRGASKPLTRSPSRPLSNTTNNTTGTDTTITPTNNRSRTPRPPPPPSKHPAYPVNDSGIGVNEYDPRMPPPPVPIALPTQSQTQDQKTTAQQKRKSKTPTLFGIALPVRSRPPTPTAVAQRAIVSPPMSSNPQVPPKFQVSANPVRSNGAGTSRVAAATPVTAPPTPATQAEFISRPRSTPPIRPRVRADSSESERDGRCSPLFGLGGGARRMFSSSRSRSKDKEKEREREREREVGRPVVMKVSATAGMGGRHPSFEFERPAELRRSTSQAGRRPSGQSSRTDQSHAQSHARVHPRSPPSALPSAHGQPHNKGATLPYQPTHPPRAQAHVHSQSTSAVRRNRAQAHASTASTAHSPLIPPSAHSQSTAGTNATGGATAGGQTGSWGRQTRTTGWVRAGVHPPFAFESAASGSGSVSAGRASPSLSEGRARLREQERERARADVDLLERERGRTGREVRTTAGARREGRWEQKEVELGLGLTWAPSKIRVREWTTPELERQREREMWEREGARKARERYEMGYTDRDRDKEGRRRKTDKEVTGRFKDVLGDAGFDTFKKYVRRFDADLIPLDGLLVRVGGLLDASVTRVGESEKHEMLDDLVRIVHENEW